MKFKDVLMTVVMSLSVSSLVWAEEFNAAESSFELHTDQKVVAIGDIHGDLHALLTILIADSIIDTQGNWIAGDSHLVLVGDLIDRGPHSKQVMDFVMSLENKAKDAGGFVHALLGNHEFLVTMGALKYIHENDITAYGVDRGKNQMLPLINAFQGNSTYAQWFRSRKVMIRIGDTLFVHGGLDDWVYDYSISQINQGLNHWIQYIQGVAANAPKYSTRFLIEGDGPLWNRRFGVESEDAHSESDVQSFLNHYEVKRVVVGHTIIPILAHTLNHPFYGNKVMMIDSAISIAYGGELTAVEFQNNQITHFKFNRYTGQRELVGLQEAPRGPAVTCTQALNQ